MANNNLYSLVLPSSHVYQYKARELFHDFLKEYVSKSQAQQIPAGLLASCTGDIPVRVDMGFLSINRDNGSLQLDYRLSESYAALSDSKPFVQESTLISRMGAKISCCTIPYGNSHQKYHISLGEQPKIWLLR